MQQATVTVNEIYLLDASTDPADAARTDFYCGSPLVVLNFNGLPQGVYALAILHASGVAQPQQASLVLSKTTDNRWLLAGFFDKPMVADGHDGLWYWVNARKYAQSKMNWSAWFYYRMASDLLDPVNFLSSANLEKLQHESSAIRPDNLPAAGAQPVALNAHGSVFSLNAVDTTTMFGGLDLSVGYTPDATQAAQLHDPLSARKQVMDIVSTLLEQHPDLKGAFHGIWVHADQGDASLFALELPMSGVATAPQSPGANSIPAVR